MSPQDESGTNETVARAVQPTEIHDLLADVEDMIRATDAPYIRVTVEAVSAEQRRANKKLAAEVEETDTCLNCGDEIRKGGFCSFDCFVSMGGDGSE
jgi:succinate dehydrogenase/fumarate reductase-like Fe-S protein